VGVAVLAWSKSPSLNMPNEGVKSKGDVRQNAGSLGDI
jgi:hypothetical protein